MKILHSVIISLILLLSATTAHSATYYFHNDHLGTPQVLTDKNQAVVWKGAYDPFGQVTETVATVEQNLRFPGQYLDRESGLHYNYFRTYDPEVGRYTQSGPIGLGGGVNTYGYAYQSPLIYTDPTGELGLVGAAIGGVTGAVSGFVGAIATGANYSEAAVAAGVGAVGGSLSGFFGGASIGLTTAVSVYANLVGQGIGHSMSTDCSVADIDWIDFVTNEVNVGSILGSAFGGGWAGAITRGAGPVSGAVISWGPSTVSGALGNALGE